MSHSTGLLSSFRRVQASHGRDAVGVFGGGSLTNEKAYLLGKFARVALGTSNIDYNGRFCMSSAAAAATRALGVDRGLPFPLEDIARAETILLVGGNVAETMPPIMRYFEAQQRNGGTLIVADPRRSATASWAKLHLRLQPGSDAALANGLLHLVIRDGLIDHDYIRDRTEGFEEVKRHAAAYWPERVEMLTGVPQSGSHRSCATARQRTDRDGHHRARPGTAGVGRQQRACVHQPGARARQSGPSIQRFRHADRTGKRAGRA